MVYELIRSEQQEIPAGSGINSNYIQSCTFMDGYTIWSRAGTKQFFISSLYDTATSLIRLLMPSPLPVHLHSPADLPPTLVASRIS